jgi:hypothetical protein
MCVYCTNIYYAAESIMQDIPISPVKVHVEHIAPEA